MTEALSQIPLLQLFAGLAAGLALGLFHFATLHRVAALYVEGGSAPKALALQLGRFALLVAGLIGIGQGLEAREALSAFDAYLI